MFEYPACACRSPMRNGFYSLPNVYSISTLGKRPKTVKGVRSFVNYPRELLWMAQSLEGFGLDARRYQIVLTPRRSNWSAINPERVFICRSIDLNGDHFEPT
jgi:hypothetical protein